MTSGASAQAVIAKRAMAGECGHGRCRGSPCRGGTVEGEAGLGCLRRIEHRIQGLLPVQGEVAQCLRHGIEAVLPEDQGQGEVVAGRTVGRAVVGAGQAGILAERAVADVVVRFDDPVAAVPFRQLSGVRLLRGDRGEAVDGLGAGRFRIPGHLPVAVDAEGLAHVPEAEAVRTVDLERGDVALPMRPWSLSMSSEWRRTRVLLHGSDRSRSSCRGVFSLTLNR